MSHQDKHREDLKRLTGLHELLHRLPRIPPKSTNNPISHALLEVPQSVGIGNLKKAIDKGMERIQWLYNISRYPDEDRWDPEWLPLGLAVANWEGEGYERCWILLDQFLEDLSARVAQLHRYGELRHLHDSFAVDSEPPAIELTPLDEEILGAIGDGTLLGKEVAREMGRDRLTDPIKKRLASLVKKGVLKSKPRHGYSRVAASSS
ncbi:hypothetical protein H8E07_20525 [bacterium]|nr:hypothetical protein [bacterium]